MKNLGSMWTGFFQAFGVAVYCFLVGLFAFNAGRVFGRPGFLGPVMFLTLFSVSALICALIVFYKPYRLFFDGKKKEAIEIIVFTTTWLFLIFLIFAAIALLS